MTIGPRVGKSEQCCDAARDVGFANAAPFGCLGCLEFQYCSRSAARVMPPSGIVGANRALRDGVGSTSTLRVPAWASQDRRPNTAVPGAPKRELRFRDRVRGTVASLAGATRLSDSEFLERVMGIEPTTYSLGS